MSSCGSALNYSPGNFWLLRLRLPGISVDELAPKAFRSADDDTESAAAARTQHWHDVEGHRAARNDPQEAGEDRPVLPSAVHDQRSRRPSMAVGRDRGLARDQGRPAVGG